MSDAQRVRHATDAGRTKDKIRFPDLAAAPLGTDDEAGGHQPQSALHPPERGDRVADGDPRLGELYKPRSEEDNRAPVAALPTWRTWGFIAAALIALAAAAVVMTA
ncbi:MAG: hypothetical protein AB1592_00415 [Pseudomonadota bacterium]